MDVRRRVSCVVLARVGFVPNHGTIRTSDAHGEGEREKERIRAPQ